ncbi:hypothetical protein MTP10_04480 [Nonomuraea sp. 3-1Str]|uniref:hypothetical protein n=1 Tax=Nonomuraea sp. 3-1Str TaxID=2929801 RepID=UPI0028581757|nr:hypothetical protein [Nonomuraea sp. 3-1Str]MDR8407986.1 hypothetical protein [Nonomuraea sp. 3-1Str]
MVINVRKGLVLLTMGTALVPVYAALNYVAIQMGDEALRRGPEWEGGVPLNDAMSPVAAYAWMWTCWVALGAGLVGVALIVIGALLLRLRGRGRTGLLTAAWVIAVPYLPILFLALLNPVRAGIFDLPDYEAGLPWWQSATHYLLMAAALVQAMGLTWLARASANPSRR